MTSRRERDRPSEDAGPVNAWDDFDWCDAMTCHFNEDGAPQLADADDDFPAPSGPFEPNWPRQGGWP
jgi:hypothetical protein